VFEGSWRGERRREGEGDVSETAERLSWREEVLLRVGETARGRQSIQPLSRLDAAVRGETLREAAEGKTLEEVMQRTAKEAGKVERSRKEGGKVENGGERWRNLFFDVKRLKELWRGSDVYALK